MKFLEVLLQEIQELRDYNYMVTNLHKKDWLEQRVSLIRSSITISRDKFWINIK